MKKTVRVVKEMEYEIEIDDSILNQSFVWEFEEGFWEIDGDNLDDKITSLFKVAAHQLANGEENFIEGIGSCASTSWKKLNPQKDVRVVYKEIDNCIESEIVED